MPIIFLQESSLLYLGHLWCKKENSSSWWLCPTSTAISKVFVLLFMGTKNSKRFFCYEKQIVQIVSEGKAKPHNQFLHFLSGWRWRSGRFPGWWHQFWLFAWATLWALCCDQVRLPVLKVSGHNLSWEHNLSFTFRKLHGSLDSIQNVPRLYHSHRA